MSRQSELLVDVPSHVGGVAERVCACLRVAAELRLIQRVVHVPRKVGVGRTVLVVHRVVWVHPCILRKRAVWCVLGIHLRVCCSVGDSHHVLDEVVELESYAVSLAVVILHHTLSVAEASRKFISQVGCTSIHPERVVV